MSKTFIVLLLCLFTFGYWSWEEFDIVDKTFTVGVGVLLTGMWVLLCLLESSFLEEPRE